MKITNLFLSGMSLLIMACNSNPVVRTAGVIPAPVSLETTSNEPFILRTSTTVAYSDAALEGVAQRFADDLTAQTGSRLRVTASDKAKNAIVLTLNPNLAIPAKTVGISPKDGNPADERYTLTVGKDVIRIEGAAPEGVYRGVTTLRQLTGAGKLPIALAPVSIDDAPHYAWRGLSLDVSRTFYTANEVKQVIDMLALYKMNVLHLHLSDNEGWRIEIKALPELTARGSEMNYRGRKGGFYTQSEYRDLVAYAAERFITIVPEIDMPGHTAAAFAAYPELKNAVSGTPPALAQAGMALMALDPDDEVTMQGVQLVLNELAAITPGSYLHIGGDETFGMDNDKYVRFIDRVRDMVKATGKKLVGWQEASRANIGTGDLIQNWVNFNMDQMMGEGSALQSALPSEFSQIMVQMFAEAPKDVERALGKGAKIIVSPSSYVYFDNPHKEVGDSTQEADRARLGMQFYAGLTLETAMQWMPSTYNPLLNDENIAGVEAAIWCETIEKFPELQFMIMPRLSGVAEKGWSPAKPTDWTDYRARLATQSPLWQQFGWNFFRSSLVDWE